MVAFKRTEQGAIPDMDAALEAITNLLWARYSNDPSIAEKSIATSPADRLSVLKLYEKYTIEIENRTKAAEEASAAWYANKQAYEEFEANPPINYYEGCFVVIRVTTGEGVIALIPLGQHTVTPEYSSPSAAIVFRSIIEAELSPVLFGFSGLKWDRSVIQRELDNLTSKLFLAFELDRIRTTYQPVVDQAVALQSYGY